MAKRTEGLKMRTNANIQSGQIWIASDPRRLRKVEVIEMESGGHCEVFTKVLYPLSRKGLVERLPRRFFMQTGTKGYTRVS